MEWNILVIGGGTLIVFVGAIIKPIISLNRTLVMLDNSITNLGKEFCRMRDDNKTSHTLIFEKLGDHEYRLKTIEKK